MACPASMECSATGCKCGCTNPPLFTLFSVILPLSTTLCWVRRQLHASNVIRSCHSLEDSYDTMISIVTLSCVIQYYVYNLLLNSLVADVYISHNHT